ncbi:cupin domain-containing protein [Nonomuraea sp. LP-02]|uniref:cupin domain-containing protein n=1 Tax=Nonomuraea sp. LP-02 TaxID=3097960 RepID=UPI002E305631|nr:cupin domain-containing protein [Nonomuraea sp. LP-02]MED7927773.1 cupin domain-containing protein [Nonomuraea sp. LP-02]
MSLLKKLLYPHDLETFFSRIWEQDYLHIRRADNPALHELLPALVSLEDLDELLTVTYATGSHRSDALCLTREGHVLAPGEYLRPAAAGQPLVQIDVERALTLYRHGASITLNRVNEALPTVGGLCDELSAFFGVRVHANAYFTPADAQGFPTHFDTHDVILLQLVGAKNWHIQPPPVQLPTPTMHDHGAAPTGPVSEVLLRSAELLYIPRGFVHQGIATDAPSVHLTLGITPYPWSWLLHRLLDDLERNDADFRRSVAPQLGRAALDESRLTETLTMLAARLVDTERVLRALDHQVAGIDRPGGMPLRGLLTQLTCHEEVTPASLVRLKQSVQVDLSRSGDRIMLSFGHTVLTLPAFTEAALRILCSGAAVCAAQLPAEIDDSGKLVLIKRLIREELLEFADPLVPA